MFSLLLKDLNFLLLLYYAVFDADEARKGTECFIIDDIHFTKDKSYENSTDKLIYMSDSFAALFVKLMKSICFANVYLYLKEIS